MSQKIFIPAATGTIGSQIVKQLQKEHITFTAGLSKEPESNPSYDYAIINYADRASLETAFKGIDTLFLLFPIAADLMNYASNAIQVAKNAGVKNIVRSGAIGASVDSPYQLIQMHGQIDKIVEDSGINYTMIQPTGFMQNFVTFLGYPIKQGTVYNSNPSGRVAFVDARDIAAVCVKVIKNPAAFAKQKIEISGGEAFTIPQGLSKISAAIKRPINFVPISHQQAHDALKQYGASNYVANLIGSVELASEEGAMATVHDGVQNVLGRAPISFDQFVNDHVAVWQ